jgi:hypothetical protein
LLEKQGFKIQDKGADQVMKGTPDSKTMMSNYYEGGFEDTADVKPEGDVSTYDEKEILFYFNQIPSADQQTILKKMATQSSEKYEPNDDSDDVMEKLYRAYAEDKKQKEAGTAKMGFPPPPTPLVPLPNYSKTGLEINLAGRKTSKLESTKVILFKNERGNDPVAKKKTGDKVVKAIEPKLSTNNISRIITSEDAASFDVAADALSWQAHLKNIRRFCLQYDMLSILNIPKGVDYSDPHNVIRHTAYKDAIEDRLFSMAGIPSPLQFSYQNRERCVA